NVVDTVAEILFNYLHDVIYDPVNALLDVGKLPEGFQDFGNGLCYFVQCVMETKALAQALAKGDLSEKAPSPGNEIAAPLKSLHASLRHLTWQTQQVAQGDYQQRVKFMGDFAVAFNSMAQQLEERKKTETKERSKLQQYINLILANTPNIHLVFDTEGKAVLASEAYLRCGKIPSIEEIQGKSFSELFSPIATNEFLHRMDMLFDNALIRKQTAKIEQCIDFGQDGSLRSYQIHVTPMLYENDAVMGTMVVFHDMTEIIQAQHEAERARESAEQSTRAKSDFLARMSHEMRTPMNAIIGMTSIGKAAPDIEKKDYSFHKIGDTSMHLLGLINDILDMSQIEEGKLDLSYGVFNFESMVNRIVRDMSLRAAEKEQHLVAEVDKNIPLTVISDEQHLAQVITNLLSNAVKSTPEYGSIKLSAVKTAGTSTSCTIRVTVKDTGIGISKEQQEYLFTPFEQADGSVSRKFGGVGLGLSISKRIVEMMGGTIWVESELDKGASFIFDIAVQTNAEDTVNDETANHPDGGNFTGKRILIADDVEINREIIAALLEGTGVEIDFAFDGAEAVEKYLSAPNAYGLIFMDIQMPGIDGYEATRRIRSSGLPEADQIPIIAMTANVFREDVERCLAAGMNGHLGKPIDVNEVIAKLGEYLR
ncbi:MAG: ATP-binding protein, partial [Clostridia bacterium]|nr:ATP-binding protein [Clostridia bacterium]